MVLGPNLKPHRGGESKLNETAGPPNADPSGFPGMQGA